MRSAFGDSAGLAFGSRAIFWPSRGKMRSSMPPTSARRASIGTSRRQSDDQSSESTRILAGAWGCVTSQRTAPTCSSLSRTFSY